MLVAGFWAALLSGIPSTAHAWWTGRDLLEATRAAGAMILPPGSGDVALFAAAAVAHGAITIFWAAILVWLLRGRWLVPGSIAGAAAIAVVDLRLIAPLFFPAVAALDFWPQFADHIAWGAALGTALQWRKARRAKGLRGTCSGGSGSGRINAR